MKKILFIFSIVANIVFSFILISERKSFEWIDSVSFTMKSEPISLFQFTKNPNYIRLNSLFYVYEYPKSPTAVMLGDSMTNYADWRLLLNDPTIVNFGIPGDTTEGFLSRLDLIIQMKPKRVFLMGGINDIRHNTPLTKITENMTIIVTTLQKNNIEVIIQSTLPVTSKYSDSARINRDVSELNKDLKQLATSVETPFIELRPTLTNEQGYLQNKLTYDGLHLIGNGYLRWREALKPFSKSI